jgi:hypothetical protein
MAKTEGFRDSGGKISGMRLVTVGLGSLFMFCLTVSWSIHAVRMAFSEKTLGQLPDVPIGAVELILTLLVMKGAQKGIEVWQVKKNGANGSQKPPPTSEQPPPGS